MHFPRGPPPANSRRDRQALCSYSCSQLSFQICFLLMFFWCCTQKAFERSPDFKQVSLQSQRILSSTKFRCLPDLYLQDFTRKRNLVTLFPPASFYSTFFWPLELLMQVTFFGQFLLVEQNLSQQIFDSAFVFQCAIGSNFNQCECRYFSRNFD